jgi:hypothetical protein
VGEDEQAQRALAMQVIRRTLEGNGQSQRWLARTLGMKEPRLNHYLWGRNRVPEQVVMRVCQLLNINSARVLTPETEKYLLQRAGEWRGAKPGVKRSKKKGVSAA